MRRAQCFQGGRLYPLAPSSRAAGTERVVTTKQRSFNLIFHLPLLLYALLSAVLIAAVLCKIGVRYAFNVNEGWNAFWATAAWTGADLYPSPSSLKLNNYVPLWFYATGAL